MGKITNLSSLASRRGSTTAATVGAATAPEASRVRGGIEASATDDAELFRARLFGDACGVLARVTVVGGRGSMPDISRVVMVR